MQEVDQVLGMHLYYEVEKLLKNWSKPKEVKELEQLKSSREFKKAMDKSVLEKFISDWAISKGIEPKEVSMILNEGYKNIDNLKREQEVEVN